MTPIRFLVHMKAMCSNPVETPATIKAMAQDYRTTANADKEYDIKYYAQVVMDYIDKFVTDGWIPAELKIQLKGLLSNFIPDIT